MKCTSCGNELVENANFCTSCGKKIEDGSVSSEQTPIATYINNGDAKPKKNTGLIILIAVLGFIVFFGIVFVIVVNIVFKSIINEIINLEPKIPETVEKTPFQNGDVVKTVKDPMGNEIKIVKDYYYIYIVDKTHISEEMEIYKTTISAKTEEEIDASDATPEQKEAMKKVSEMINDYKTLQKDSIYNELRKDGYSEEVIKFAMENTGVNWKQHAYIEALSVLSMGRKTPKVLRSWLETYGYSEEEIKYVEENKKLDFYEQAVDAACYYRYSHLKYGGDTYTEEEVENELKEAGFTDKEIEFAITVVFTDMPEE